MFTDLYKFSNILAPKGIQHELGQRPQTRILDDLIRIQLNTFFDSIIGDVTGFLLVGVAIGRESARLLFDFEEGVDVIFE